MYTTADLEAARAELTFWSDRFADDGSNNPDKYRSDIESARSKVRRIEEHLKATGEIPLTEQETLERTLDKAFPNARSRDVVTHEGVRYQRWFRPAAKSRSGKTVKERDKGWSKVS